MRAGQGTVRAEAGPKRLSIRIDHKDHKFLILLHALGKVEINKHFNHEPKFNGVYSGNNLHKIRDRTYVKNLDQRKRKVLRWVYLFSDSNAAEYFFFFFEMSIFLKKYQYYRYEYERDDNIIYKYLPKETKRIEFSI